MELFFLIVIGLTAISFISIVLTKPSPIIQQKLLPEPAKAELISVEDAKPLDSQIKHEDIIILQVEEQELVEEGVLATMA